MRLFKKVSIIGTGLVGGSIALAIKKNRLAAEVIGVSRTKSTLLRAKKIGAIDAGSVDLNIIRGSDLVILSAPVGTILNLSSKISKFIAKDSIVTDVGSTKGKIAVQLDKVFPNYVGGHPLAGSEKRGISYASSAIFKGTLCILTPTKNTNNRSLNKIKELWEILGAKVVFLDPQKHDRILAFVSHLPHVAAFSLINTVPERYLKFSASGLRDTTRIAASDSELWSDIFLSNRANILEAVDLLNENIRRIKSAIIKKDRRLLNKILNKAKQRREIL